MKEWKNEYQHRYYLRHRDELIAKKTAYNREHREEQYRRQRECYRRKVMKEWNESTEEVG